MEGGKGKYDLDLRPNIKGEVLIFYLKRPYQADNYL